MAKSKEYLLENDAEGCFKTEGINSFAQIWRSAGEEGHGLRRQYNDIEMLEWAGLGVAVAVPAAEKAGRIMWRKRGGLSRGGSGKNLFWRKVLKTKEKTEEKTDDYTVDKQSYETGVSGTSRTDG